MKRILLLLFFLTTALGLAQVGVNTTTPDPSSMLDISATNKGVLVPRVSLANVTTTTLDGTNTAATGLLIWNTNATTVGGNGVGFYFFNGTQWIPITQTTTSDHDWYEVGTTTAPNAITDRMFHTGSVAIGKNTITVDNPKLSIEENGAGAGLPLRIFSLKDASTSTTSHTGAHIEMAATSSASEYGITVEHTNPNAPLKYGVQSSVKNGSGTNGAFEGRVLGTGFNSGASILIQNSGSPSSGMQTGYLASFEQATTAYTRGLHNQFQSNNLAFDTGSKYGMYNEFGSSSQNTGGELYGSYNIFEPTLTSATNKYGSYTTIPSTVGGTHYGIYSDVTKGNSYAGYFLGRMSIGTTTFNNYILPPSRGTNGQTMQTDGSGNVTWVTPTSSTDADWFLLNTTNPASAITDNIYTQGKVSVGSSTLSNGKLNVYNSLESNSFYSENTGSPTIATSSGYFVNNGIGAHTRYGIQTNISGGGTGQKFGAFNSINTSSTDWQVGVSNFMSGSNASLVYGFRNDISTTGSAAQQQYGVYNDFSTISDSQIMGVYNFNGSNGNGIHYGTQNRIIGNGNGLKYGTYNFIAGVGTGLRYGVYNYLTGSGTNSKYGTFNSIDPLAGGTHYGLYSEALKAGSYAGYFLGNVSIGTTTTNNYILPASRGTNGQIMQTDGTGNLTWVNPTLSDADWYEVGGTNSPDAITDNKFTLGDISIGKITAASGKLDVDAALKNVTTSFLNNNTTTGSKWGIQNNVVVDTNNDSSYGISNAITGNADFKYGIYNTISGAITGGTAEYGLVNNHLSSGFVNGIGVFNFFNPSASHTGSYTGLHNEIGSANHTGGFIGVNNLAGLNTNSSIYGMANSLSGSGSGARVGVYNYLTGNSTGDFVGTETFMIAPGTGNKYGERITILNSTPGTHYGVYSDVTKTNSFAGYFLGKVSVGTNIIDNYVLPSSRGLNGQIMQTDGAGNVSWADAPADADWYEVGGLTPANSILDNIFTGGDVSIGKATAAIGKVDVEADNKASTLVLENNNATAGLKYGLENNLTANANNALSSGILNRISGLSPLKFGYNNFYSNTNPGASITEVGYNTDFTSTGNVNFIGHSNTIFPFSTNLGSIIGYQNNVTGSATGIFTGFQNSHLLNNNTTRTGLLNTIGGGGTGDIVGTNNSFSGSSSGEYIGTNTSIISTGTGLKYGEKIFIDNTSGGIHCGIYADVTKANSYAGYFLGRVSIGNTLANNYILPASRGTNGQIMQTDGVGNVSWTNLPTYADTDDQTIDVLSLIGDTLNISLQDDAVATQTLNLGAIDNQGTDVFSLTGNTLNLSLQNDGVATQTVDLSSLSNDWKLTGNAGTLSGTNFLGTTDAQDLDFRVNNVVKIRLTQQGQLSFVNAGGSVFVGINAGDSDDLTSNQNTFVGATSGQFTTTGNLNTAIGHASLNANISGQGNSGLGKSSLLTNTTGSNNTGVGRLADVATSGLSNATAVGFNATVSVSDKVRLGSTTVTVVEGQVPYTNPSDARFKFNVQENVPGLDFIKKLKPVTYNFDTKKFDEHLNKNRNREEVATEDFSRSTAIVRTGFLAQDVEKICTDLGYNFDGLHVPDASNPTDNYGIAYSQFIMPIVKAVQEQQVIIETQKTELEQLKSKLEKYKMLEERIKALEQK